jgi:hypothetical protein
VAELLTISADEYHADPSEIPSLSSSIAAILCQQSPAHAWAAHPKLNPNFERTDKTAFDLGTTVHQLLLEGHTDSIVAIDADNYRTKAAQEERDAAYAAGRTPMLVKELPRVQAMVEAVTSQLARHEADPPLFKDGKAEQTLMWEEDGGVVCRARIDWIRDDLTAVDDLKSVGRSADPDSCVRAIATHGYDLKAAFYLRGLWETLEGAPPPAFRWCFVETDPPYALSVIAPSAAMLELGRKKCDYAINLWRRCLDRDEWPGYTTKVAYAETPAWDEAKWLEKELREEMA